MIRSASCLLLTAALAAPEETLLADPRCVGHACRNSSLARLVEVVLREAMPMERLRTRPTYAEEVWRARNSEEALLACASACATVTGSTTDVEWATPVSFGSWLRRLVGQRSDTQSAFFLGHLNGLRLDGQQLQFADLANTSGAKASFAGATLTGANLSEADLTEVDFTDADLRGANFSGANLTDANLTRARLSGCRFAGASTTGACLDGALISGSGISGEHLQATKGTPAYSGGT